MTGDDKDRAGVIAPPPLIYLAFLLLGLGLDYLWPVAVIPEGVQYPAGFLLIALGLALFAAAVWRFGKARRRCGAGSESRSSDRGRRSRFPVRDLKKIRKGILQSAGRLPTSGLSRQGNFLVWRFGRRGAAEGGAGDGFLSHLPVDGIDAGPSRCPAGA